VPVVSSTPWVQSAPVFDHVTIRVSDSDASERFYDTVLPIVGVEKTHSDERLAEWSDFSVLPGGPVTRRLHVGFAAPSRAVVDEFWRAGTAAGYREDGAPGPRPEYRDDYYGAFLLDPDGNSIEAVHHGGMRIDKGIDHMWIRVADVEAAARFYDTVAAHTGFGAIKRSPERVHFRGPQSSFTLIEGPLTENAHIAFPASENAVVDEFHAVATGAGYADNGAAGERSEYHPGYYAAYVLDPDGNNVEVVNHNR
jgi:catechol 2,3-dioxygenase-like lactoylglutathione lyase family enzyme